MRSIDTAKIRYISWVYAFIITFLLVAITAGFIYIFQRAQAADKASEIRAHLIAVFDENENIADAITAKYTTVLQHTTCATYPIYRVQNVYGFNFSEKTANTDYNGTLLAQSPLDREGACLVHAASFIINSLIRSNLITHDGFRYILSEKNRFIYTFSHLESTDFNITESKMFNDMPTFVASAPEYYERKLTNDLKRKGTVATPFYKDKLSGNTTYSIVSFIYDLNQNHKPVAYLLYDHSASELREKISNFIPDIKWLKISIMENATGEQLCFINCDIATGRFTAVLSEKLSGKHTLRIKIDIMRGIISSLIFQIILGLAFIHLIMLRNLIKDRMTRNQEASVIDHLTGLYNRKVLTRIHNNISRGNYIVMIDCNQFKEINDQYGHNVGDAVLMFTGDTIKNEIRKEDIAIRHGGDEFLIILNTSSQEIAAAVVGRISGHITAKEFKFGDDKFRSSISYGIAPYNGDLSLAIHEADKQMYIMKHSLKNSSQTAC